MARFVRGHVVVVPFPFTDLSASKRRPALVIAVLKGKDYILCQITTQASKDPYTVPLASADFSSGSLKRPSNIRPNRLFTAQENLILYRVGKLKAAKLEEVTSQLIDILKGKL